MVAARIGWIEVALLSVRSSRVRLGMRQGKIAACRGYLGARLCGRRGSAREMAHGFRHRGPLVWAWLRWWFSPQVRRG